MSTWALTALPPTLNIRNLGGDGAIVYLAGRWKRRTEVKSKLSNRVQVRQTAANDEISLYPARPERVK